jgi:AmiR/NasT family two-component response regulator
MRVWLIQSKPGEQSVLEPMLRNPASGEERREVEIHPAGSSLVSVVRSGRPEILVVTEAACPAGPWTEELLALGVALVVAVAPNRASAYTALAERFPIELIPANPNEEALTLALRAALAALRRQRHGQEQIEQLQQRLNDRIVIERAKGVLVQRLGVTEEEAYRRLRVLSRRQRRQIRDIAQSLLDTQALFMPDMNGFGDLMNDGQASQPSHPSSAGG